MENTQLKRIMLVSILQPQLGSESQLLSKMSMWSHRLMTAIPALPVVVIKQTKRKSCLPKEGRQFPSCGRSKPWFCSPSEEFPSPHAQKGTHSLAWRNQMEIFTIPILFLHPSALFLLSSMCRREFVHWAGETNWSSWRILLCFFSPMHELPSPPRVKGNSCAGLEKLNGDLYNLYLRSFPFCAQVIRCPWGRCSGG